jgi:hypothetical protein
MPPAQVASSRVNFAEPIQRGAVASASPSYLFRIAEISARGSLGISMQYSKAPGDAHAILVRQKNEGMTAMRQPSRAVLVSKGIS